MAAHCQLACAVWCFAQVDCSLDWALQSGLVTSPVAYRLKLPDSFGCLHNVFHASLLKPHRGAVSYHAEPIVVEAGAAAEPEFEFEALL